MIWDTWQSRYTPTQFSPLRNTLEEVKLLVPKFAVEKLIMNRQKKGVSLFTSMKSPPFKTIKRFWVISVITVEEKKPSPTRFAAFSLYFTRYGPRSDLEENLLECHKARGGRSFSTANQALKRKSSLMCLSSSVKPQAPRRGRWEMRQQGLREIYRKY